MDATSAVRRDMTQTTIWMSAAVAHIMIAHGEVVVVDEMDSRGRLYGGGVGRGVGDVSGGHGLVRVGLRSGEDG
jgi:hypothetical protein